MRTTVDIPDPLFRRAKSTASLLGLSLREFLTQAIEHEANREMACRATRGRCVDFPLVPAKGPRAVDLTNEKIAELLEEEDISVSAGR